MNIRYYIIYAEKDKFREICKNIEKETYFGLYKHSNGRDCPGGYFIGWSCIGYFDNREKYEDSDKIYIITTTKFYKKIIEVKEVEYVNSFSEEKVIPSKIMYIIEQALIRTSSMNVSNSMLEILHLLANKLRF